MKPTSLSTLSVTLSISEVVEWDAENDDTIEGVMVASVTLTPENAGSNGPKLKFKAEPNRVYVYQMSCSGFENPKLSGFIIGVGKGKHEPVSKTMAKEVFAGK